MIKKQAELRSEAKWLIFWKSKFRSLVGISSPRPKTLSHHMHIYDLVVAAGTQDCHKMKI